MSEDSTPGGRVIGYCRVSTTDGRQKTDLQRDALAKAGVTVLYEDHCSGAKTSRPQLDACLADLTTGDTLVIWRLDRLGRSSPHLLEVVADMDARGLRTRTAAGRRWSRSDGHATRHPRHAPRIHRRIPTPGTT